MSELRRLRYFLAVAEERNYTRAAERLHIAQPALSRQVRELERELGVELLARTTHKVEPTEAGRMLLERGPALLEAAESLWRGVREFADGRMGSVSLGYGMSAGYETAPQLLRAMGEEAPGIEVSARVMAFADIIDSVAARTLDVGLVRSAQPETLPDDVELTLLRRERQGVVISREHPLAASGAESVDPAALDGLKLLLHPRAHNPGHYDEIMEICARAGAKPEVLYRGLDFDASYTPVASGSAVTMVGYSGRIGLPSGLLWLPVTPPAFIEVHLVTRRVNHSPAVNRLLRVAEQTSRQQGWLTGALEEPVAGVRNRRTLPLDGADIGAIDGAYEV
ncbi:LysR substrate-binding domain-containing protein [Streptacidiphilus jiangxiensis]|uniref:DNA-binding transcriptional regulator, LysR family n=1 Tax=Streptacidiphilus jiangxiensis TaxID=235985 RepID=A0A1H7PS04_STRJI|nr:LysR substrate-binding domain-containing protein [Streptacidiphilus jiangxiensis]SEL38366.1 DNA-binding transcriptional regulator, LysR family [Streptacidiphilus jiangxiensis]